MKRNHSQAEQINRKTLKAKVELIWYLKLKMSNLY